MIARPISLALAAVVALVALRAAPARAQPDVATRAKAAAHFRQGQAFFQNRDFDRALAEYQAALDLSAEPLLIFNIALCHDRANRPEPALAAFQRYLELAPTGAVADEARDDIARLTPIVAKLAAERTTEAARRREEAARRAATARREEAARRAERADARRRRLRNSMIAAGAVVAVAGATFHGLAWRTRNRLSDAPDPDAYFADRDTFKLERNVAIGAYAAGAITIATGLILGRVLRPHNGVEVSAAVTPGSVAMAVGWSR